MLKIKSNRIVLLLIVAFTTMWWNFSIGPFSLLMLLSMGLSVTVLSIKFRYVSREEIPLYSLLAMMTLAALIHSSTFRITTIVYSFGFVLTFILYMRIINSNRLDVSQFLSVVHKLVYAYAIVLIIQQISVTIGIPVFNQCWVFSGSSFKLNSLSHEPSYIGGTLWLLMYAHVKLWRRLNFCKNNKQDFCKNKWLWLSYAYVSITCLSSLTAFAFGLMLIFLFKNNKKILIPVSLGLVLCSPFLLAFASNIQSLDRLVKFIPAVISGDTDYIRSVDLSAAARLNPILFYFQDFDLLDPSLWLGHGVDYSKNTIIARLLGNSDYMEQGNATGGLFPAFFLDFGLLTGCCFLWCLKKYAVKKWNSYILVVWIFCFLPLGFNTYMTWMFFMLMYSVNFFDRELQDGKI